MTDAEALAQFEALVQSQTPATTAWAPVTDYSEEARKQAEGPHARLILDTFHPTAAADIGCGFNYLAQWVNERAGFSLMTGFDKDNPAADMIADITEAAFPFRRCFPLVVCREVLEHLTIRDVTQAVRNLCGMSSRFVYVTTRFAKTPAHLLSVDTSDDLDPTHITMLNQDFLRVLFVLEGFTRRADLEAKLDWQGKGRVLVYERV